MTISVGLVVGLSALLGLTAVTLKVGRIRLGYAPYTAVLRGGLQLAFVGIALHGVLNEPVTVFLALAVMLTVASRVSASRLRELDHPGIPVATACALGSGVTLGTVFLTGMLPTQPRYVVALGGIVIGNTMTASTLTGRHLLSGMRARRDEIEGWLALGATNRQAVAEVARDAATEALLPVLDQTRTTGLVTLPGAFIGALLGGASPSTAARFQLIVLVSLIAAESVVAVASAHMLGSPTTLPEPVVESVADSSRLTPELFNRVRRLLRRRGASAG
jgi:putative ABC transport system permease protein